MRLLLLVAMVAGCSRYADGCYTASCHLRVEESERRARAEIERGKAEAAAFEQQQRELAAYRQCRAFIFDVDAAAKDPPRAEACTNVVLAFERQREAAEAERTRQAAERAEAMEAEGLRMQQRADDDARRARVVEAIGKAFQRPPTYTTDCTTSGNTTNCTTRAH